MTRLSFIAALVLAVGLTLPPNSTAQLPGVKNGEWRYLGGDAGHTRSNPELTQINAANFSEFQVAWIWRGSNFWAGLEHTHRATPVFVDGLLCTVSGQRRLA
jgi:glucose dehydrogenase